MTSRALLIAFAFTLTLPAFGGLRVTIEAPTIQGCLDARTAARKQLMLAGLPIDTLTACALVPPAVAP